MRISSKADFDRELPRLRPRLIRYAQKILKNVDDAEDVVQDSLLYAWTVVLNGTTIDCPPAYLRTLVRHRASRFMGTTANRQRLAPQVRLGGLIDEIDDSGRGISCDTPGGIGDFLRDSRGIVGKYQMRDTPLSSLVLDQETSLIPVLQRVREDILLQKVKEVLDRDRVTAKARQRWWLHVYEGKTQQEVADLMGVRQQSVNYAVMRVNDALRKCVKELAQCLNY